MADLIWPADLVPYKVMFYLQPHVGGSESPLTRTRKVYGLSAPRWLARLTFRGGYNGEIRFGAPEGLGARMDAMIADLEGGLNKAVFHDWRRPRPASPVLTVGPLTIAAAAKGATSMRVGGFSPHSRAVSVGDYVGGDGRPHIVSIAATLEAGGTVGGAGSIMADASGSAIIGFRPPLSASIAAATPLRWPVTGRFDLTSEDAGENDVEVGQAVNYVLEFAEVMA